MKKALFTLLTIFVLLPTHAVETQYCPRVLTVLAQAVELPPLSHELLPLSQREEHLGAMREVQMELSYTPTIDIRFNLSFAGAGRCHYEGWDFLGNSIQARIQGSTKPEAKVSATLLIYDQRRAIEVTLSEVSRRGVIPDQEKATLSYRIKTCGATRCRAKLYPIGKAAIDDIF